MFSWIRLQSRWVLRKWRSGVASNSDRALPPPRAPPKDRSSIQTRELWAWDKRSQRKMSEGLRPAQSCGKKVRYLGKVVAACGNRRTVDCPGGCATNDGKRVAVSLEPFDLPYAFQNACLISPASSATRHGQTEHFFHRPLMVGLSDSSAFATNWALSESCTRHPAIVKVTRHKRLCAAQYSGRLSEPGFTIFLGSASYAPSTFAAAFQAQQFAGAFQPVPDCLRCSSARPNWAAGSSPFAAATARQTAPG